MSFKRLDIPPGKDVRKVIVHVLGDVVRHGVTQLSLVPLE